MNCVNVTRRHSRPFLEAKPEPCDVYFLQWWTLRIVEQHPMHEVPQAWLMMQISIKTQEKTNPF